jgi:hypothetical protein
VDLTPREFIPVNGVMEGAVNVARLLNIRKKGSL